MKKRILYKPNVETGIILFDIHLYLDFIEFYRY